MKFISTSITKKRIIFIASGFTLLFIFMIARLLYVQLFMSDEIKEKALQTWLRDIPYAAERGHILDRNGKEIVRNVYSPTLLLIPAQIKNKEEAAKEIASIINMSEEKAYEYVTKQAMNVIVHPEGRKLSEEQVTAIQALRMDGVYIAKDTKRHYPFGKQLAHITGFVGIDNDGLTGLELQYDDKLQGKNGALSYFSDAKGNRIAYKNDFYNKPINGNHLVTTIDMQIQQIVEKELDKASLLYNPDQMIAIVVDPNNGEVLSMASRPDFHPSEFQQVPQSVYNRNLPIWSTYEPGSTFKIITLAAALEEEKMDLEKDTFFDRGSIKVAGANLRCWKAGGHKEQSMLEVVENSCNPGFVHIGQLLGKEKLFEYIRAFGFGEKTGIDLSGEGTGILFKEENVGPVELATTSFGQGVSVTPIQQVMAVSAAVNGGVLYEPYFAKQWIDPETKEVIATHKPVKKRRVLSEDTSKHVREALESVVANGTGRPAYVEGYRVGGKTGTAQKVGKDGAYMKDNYILSFIGFAPADEPEVVVYVAVDNPKNTVQFGGVVTAPIVGNIIEESLSLRNIEKRKGALPKEYTWPDVPKVEVPNLIGEKKADILKRQEDFKIDLHGNGTYIIDQSPDPGVEVESGSTLKVYLSRFYDRENN